MRQTKDGGDREDAASDPDFAGGASRPIGSARLLLWFGLVAGWAELATILARDSISGRITMDALRTNRHFLWMIPASNALILGGLGLVVGVLSRRRPDLGRWLACRIGAGATAMAVLLVFEGIDARASLVLACGIGAFLGRAMESRAGSLARCVRIGLPALLLALVGWSTWGYLRTSGAERSELDALPPATSGAPNVVLIVLDAVRASSLSLYGHDRPTSPNLERLARRGVVFDEARPSSSWTLPSHASMFTGRWPHDLSVGWDEPLDDSRPTLAGYLATRGYATAGFVGNTYYCNAQYGLNRGFARYEDDYENLDVSLFEVVRSTGMGRRLLRVFGHKYHVAGGGTSLRKSAEMINRDVLGWIEGQPADRPFFAFLNYYDAHGPYVPPDGPDTRFGLNALPQARKDVILDRYRRLKAGAHRPADGTPQQVERDLTDLMRDSYESCIAYLDRQIGQLVDELDRRKVLEKTLVIVTSDHGEHFNEHGFFGHGHSLYRPEVHVPLVILPPGSGAAGSSVREPVTLRDLAATTVDILGVAARSPFPGRSLARFWRPGGASLAARSTSPSPVLSELEHRAHSTPMAEVPASLGRLRSIVAGGEVYIHNDGGREELFDLKSDRTDLHNLNAGSASHPSVPRFRAILDRLPGIDLDPPPLPGLRDDELAEGVSQPGRDGSLLD
ncbi:sulfatase [Isosphaeraceae bacterium EP7]